MIILLVSLKPVQSRGQHFEKMKIYGQEKSSTLMQPNYLERFYLVADERFPPKPDLIKELALCFASLLFLTFLARMLTLVFLALVSFVAIDGSL